MNETNRKVVTTHVLDLESGVPAPNLTVRLLNHDGAELGVAATNADGRIEQWAGVADVAPGTYRLQFEVAAYRDSSALESQSAFFPQIDIVFCLNGDRPKVHIPVLLSPYGYTTYRGS